MLNANNWWLILITINKQDFVGIFSSKLNLKVRLILKQMLSIFLTESTLNGIKD